MLLRLPIAIMATLSPVAVCDFVPQFDIVRECRFEGGSSAICRREGGRLKSAATPSKAVLSPRCRGPRCIPL